MIPHNKPTIEKEEIQAAERVLRSAQLSQGQEVQLFEEALCRKIGGVEKDMP